MSNAAKTPCRMRPLACRTLALAALLTACAVAPAAHAQKPRIVNCEITSNGKVEFRNKCRFLPEGTNGSFSISSPSGQGMMYGSIAIVSVSVVSPGVAEVRGLTKNGINSRWGEARRSTRDRACWVGTDFRICAR